MVHPDSLAFCSGKMISSVFLMTPFFLLQPFSVLPAADLNCYNLQLGRLVGSLHITFRKERLAEILHKTWDA